MRLNLDFCNMKDSNITSIYTLLCWVLASTEATHVDMVALAPPDIFCKIGMAFSFLELLKTDASLTWLVPMIVTRWQRNHVVCMKMHFVSYGILSSRVCCMNTLMLALLK